MANSRYHGIDEILADLSNVRRRERLSQLATNVAIAVAVMSCSALIAFAVAGYWPGQIPQALRWMLFSVLCGAWLGAAALLAVRTFKFHRSDAEIARLIEQADPRFRNNIINSVLLSGDNQQVSPELVQRSIHETIRQIRGCDINSSVSNRMSPRWGIGAGMSVAILLALAIFQPAPFARAMSTWLNPAAYVPHNNTISMLSISPGNISCFAGQSITIQAKIRNDLDEQLGGQVIIKDREKTMPMMAGDKFSTFTCRLGRIDQSFQYAVTVGDSRWPVDKPYYKVTVERRAKVEGIDIHYDYPPYTGLKAEDVIGADGPIEAPAGTRAKITLRLAQRVPNVLLEIKGKPAKPMTASFDNKTFSAPLAVISNSGYRMILTGTNGRTIQQLPDTSEAAKRSDGYYPIKAIPDEPPRISFVEPQADISGPLGGKLATKLKVSDKYSLTQVTFFAGGKNRPFKAVHNYKLKPASRGGLLDFAFNLADYRKGETIICYATATDNRHTDGISKRQTSASRQFKITIEDPAQIASQNAKRIDQLSRMLQAILRVQEKHRVNTEICLKKHSLIGQIRKTAAKITTGQKNVASALVTLAQKFKFTCETILVRQTIIALAKDQALPAIDQSTALAALSDMNLRRRYCQPLALSQDEIIHSLRSLLGLIPSLSGKPPSLAEHTGDDLPPDVQNALDKLKENLEKFLQEQRKAIKATNDLAKKGVENFNAEDEKILNELIQTEDKWEKFLDESFQDISKLPRQDFSDPTLLEELVSIRSDVTMAKDALSKKAMEIATALEDNSCLGSKEIEKSMEKWLPDEPDRKKWAMEDSTEQENIEMPELPTELEDIIGDLLEQEEDIFDEMQDITGKYGTSLEAGWDAVDGPISSMNADGVTGNQLPNTSEMAGRSGEGRQGKSTGQYVEDKAVGKGGRRTPTRLTADAFERGQIDDKSSDPPGGATGGGKVSGAGQEGLEGPVPAPLAGALKRLAGKQAQLLNRAERIQKRFQADNYANFKFLQAITLMNRVRKDLENYRYQNALRTKNRVLSALKQTHLTLSGKIDVQADTTSAMPKHIRDDIADAMNSSLPDEYRQALEQYYRRLSESNGE